MGSLSPSSKLATATVAPSIPSVTVRNLELLPELASLTVISQWPCPQFPYWPFWRYLASYSCLASRCHSPPWTELSTTTAGRVYGSVSASHQTNGFGDRHLNVNAGAQSVLFRSRNGRHSLGVGATADFNRGHSFGQRYRSGPNFNAGIGYRYRFG